MEVWKDIKGYDNYQVSNYGSVRSLDRMVNNKHGTLTFRKGKILKGTPTVFGYLTVSLHRNSKKITTAIHKLVAIAFLNHTPNGHKLVVDHIDNNSLNNKLDNLQIITQRENVCKDRKNGSSEFTGVSWYSHAKKWQARIQINGKSEYLGLFNCELKAAEAYQKALKEINNDTFKSRIIIQSSKHKGVTWCKYYEKWISRISRKGQNKHLGYFNCEIEASNAYKKALAEINN